jgi:hypothetical protein
MQILVKSYQLEKLYKKQKRNQLGMVDRIEEVAYMEELACWARGCPQKGTGRSIDVVEEFETVTGRRYVEKWNSSSGSWVTMTTSTSREDNVEWIHQHVRSRVGEFAWAEPIPGWESRLV